MSLSSITQKGQVTIPISMRQSLGLKTGDEVEFIIQQNQLILKKHTQAVEDLFGLFSVKHAVSDQDIKQAIIKGASRGSHS